MIHHYILIGNPKMNVSTKAYRLFLMCMKTVIIVNIAPSSYEPYHEEICLCHYAQLLSLAVILKFVHSIEQITNKITYASKSGILTTRPISKSVMYSYNMIMLFHVEIKKKMLSLMPLFQKCYEPQTPNHYQTPSFSI